MRRHNLHNRDWQLCNLDKRKWVKWFLNYPISDPHVPSLFSSRDHKGSWSSLWVLVSNLPTFPFSYPPSSPYPFWRWWWPWRQSVSFPFLHFHLRPPPFHLLLHQSPYLIPSAFNLLNLRTPILIPLLWINSSQHRRTKKKFTTPAWLGYGRSKESLLHLSV